MRLRVPIKRVRLLLRPLETDSRGITWYVRLLLEPPVAILFPEALARAVLVLPLLRVSSRTLNAVSSSMAVRAKYAARAAVPPVLLATLTPTNAKVRCRVAITIIITMSPRIVSPPRRRRLAQICSAGLTLMAASAMNVARAKKAKNVCPTNVWIRAMYVRCLPIATGAAMGR